MDYGHTLQFGTFITPVNSPPDAAVQRAVLSESLGYDLVTFQDHPYQPSFLDTWTLMSWVAARTERIHISANVLNVALRPPAVMARAAASLDLLSGGRYELALGAGGFWDAIDGMDGTRLTPGQGVDNLSESIDVIRAIWDVSERGGARFEGKYHHLRGAKRGPAPAHDMPIWVGALKPRMLRLIGQKADGWLPSLAYLQPGDLAAGQATIDEAATEAGRDPREIRRLANIGGRFGARNDGFLSGPAAQWVDELLPLALENGVGTFIVASDDPGTLRQFAEEVAPALREAVASERHYRGTELGAVRRASVLAKRRSGIDYDGIPESLAGTTIEPGDSGYSKVRSTYMRGGSPGLVIQVSDDAQVAAALAFARAQDVPLGIRSAGHGLSGRSTNDGGIIIDLSRMKAIEVLDPASRRVRIQAGARWSDVAAALEPHGWALTSGDYGGVGVGGLATAGGIGWLAREHGLAIDHLIAVDLVLADGTLVHASADENSELFWGVRGAGANFGIVTAFEFTVDEVGDVGFAQFAFDASDTAGLIERWGAAVEASPRDTTSNLIMGGRRPSQSPVATAMVVVDSDDADVVVPRLEAIASVAPLVDQSAQILPYSQIMTVPPADHDGQGDPSAGSGLIEHLTPAFAAAVERMLASGVIYFFQIRSVGGAVSDVAEDATAYAHRSANFSVTALGSDAARVDAAFAELRSHFIGLYLSFETGLDPARVEEAFPPATLARLRALKRQYDPQNVFRDNFNIAPVDPPVVE